MKHNLQTIMFVILALAISALFAYAYGHEAPSGWPYPPDCCAGKDCRPISCSTVTEKPNGDVSWLGLLFTREKVRISGDADCHVCVSYGQFNGSKALPIREAHCIFLAPTN